MDNTLPTFDSFPSYVSCIKNYGRPILPPLLSSAQRQEMADIRHQAVIAEARIARRSNHKSSLMDKAKEIMEKIEKSQINLFQLTEDNGSGDHCLASSPCNAVHNISPRKVFPSPDQGDNVANTPTSTQNWAETSLGFSHSFSIQGTESCFSETEDSGSQGSVCEDTSSQAAFSVADGDSCIVIPSTCHQSLNDTFIESHIQKDIEASKSQGACLPFGDSEGSEPNMSSEGDEYGENGDSSKSRKTSDIDETENASMATVILRSCDELPDDTDSDSIITSAAQSTDLEKYFDSPNDCQFSEGSEKTERGDRNDCSVQSISSDFESSTTLVNSDTELTPIPCLNLSVTSRNNSSCELRETSEGPFASGAATPLVFHKKKKQNGFRTHMRRSSYTLEKPSPALLQAVNNGTCDMHIVNTETLSYSKDNFLEKSSPLETVMQNSSFSQSVCFGDQLNETSDQCHAENSAECLSKADQWAYKVTRDFCDNSETCDEASVRNSACDVSENLRDLEIPGDNLNGRVTFNDNTSTVFSSLSDSFNALQAIIPGSAFETNAKKPCGFISQELSAGVSHSLLSEKVDRVDEKMLTRIFQKLQEFQKQQVEKLQEEQRQQWEKLHLEFEEQERILHEQLKSLYVSPLPVCSGKDSCSLEIAGPQTSCEATPENCMNSSGCVVSSQVPSMTDSYFDRSSPVPNRGNEILHDDAIFDPSLNAKFNRVSAAVKGYLTRRLMKTERVQGIIQTIKDTLVCAVKFHEETPVKKGLITEQDADLHQRLISQITAACWELHDIFFKISTKERMAIISQSRELARDRNKNDKVELNLTQKNSTFRRSPRSKTRPTLSSATMKYLERKNLRSSSEGKNPGVVSVKGKVCSRAVQKRPASATGRRTQLSPSASMRSPKYTPYAKTNASTKPQKNSKNAKSVRRLIYSKTDS